MKTRLLVVALASIATLNSCVTVPTGDPRLARIDTLVVIYAENHSFDNMYGMFPGANGVESAWPVSTRQVDHDGSVLPHLPPVYTHGKPNPKYPQELPNRPFRIDGPPVNTRFDERTPTPVHDYYRHIEQVNGGRNNKFVALSDMGAWTMGYYDGSSLKMWSWAKRYALADNFFAGAFGGSFINHQWLVCACTAKFDTAPESMRVQLDEQGLQKRRRSSPPSVLQGPVKLVYATVTPDGYAFGSPQPAFQPSGIAPAAGGNPDLADATNPKDLPLPLQTAKTIGDTLSAKGVSWAWYADGWNAALADGRQPKAAKREIIYNFDDPASPNFQPHHQPFNYYARFAPGTPDRALHLKDGGEFADAIEKGTLPQVSFYKPSGKRNQHPGSTDVQQGDTHIAGLLEKLEKSPQWPHMLVVVTYDENGGYWDHVAPPSGPGWSDRWGPASRVPAIFVGPMVKRGFVDHTSYDTTSIIKLITLRFGLEALPGVRERTGDLTNALEAAAR